MTMHSSPIKKTTNPKKENIQHIPVLYREVLDFCPENPKIIIDGTLGYGGHTKGLLEKFSDISRYYGFDIDPNIFARTNKHLECFSNFTGIQQSYTSIATHCTQNNIRPDYVLLDLGVNMEHFKDLSRGFSIQGNEQLDMRFDTKNMTTTAADILNTSTEQQLRTIFQEYADFSEKKSTEIAKNILKQRKHKKITHTQELKQLLSASGLGFKASIIIFQALRIATNQEMTNLETALQTIPRILNNGGIFAIITFHSIEDRIVKYAFKEFAQTEQYILANKKAIKPQYTEIQTNRASRSAKLRLLKKI